MAIKRFSYNNMLYVSKLLRHQILAELALLAQLLHGTYGYQS